MQHVSGFSLVCLVSLALGWLENTLENAISLCGILCCLNRDRWASHYPGFPGFGVGCASDTSTPLVEAGLQTGARLD